MAGGEDDTVAADEPVVLVVDDEPEVAEVFSLWLADAYDVEVTTSGQGALDVVDRRTVDVVLLDRRMPDLSGDETVAAMREFGFTGAVAMVTAVDPDFDIAEIPFDDYLVKPVTKADLRGTVERLTAVQSFDTGAREQFALARKLATLETEKSERALADSAEYQSLRRQFEAQKGSLEAAFDDLDERGRTAVLRSLDTDESSD